ncbi:MAG: hypothetical protein U0237_12875 [Thermoleophilia bacterium]
MVSRRSTAWCVLIALALAGCLAVHSLANTLAGAPSDRVELSVTAAEALLAGLAVTLVLLSAGTAMATRGRRRLVPVDGRAVVLLPAVMFCLMESAEAWLAAGGPAPSALVAPATLLGVLLQLPLGVLVRWVARALVHTADRVARSVSHRPGAAPGPGVAAVWASTGPRRRAAGRPVGRGPPRAVPAPA